MKWIKASERLPEATNGYAKDLVYKVHRDSGIRLMVSTVNQFLDTVKYRIAEKYEWLDESSQPSTGMREALEEIQLKIIGYLCGISELGEETLGSEWTSGMLKELKDIARKALPPSPLNDEK